MTLVKCVMCGEWFERVKGPGRPRIYCADECRKRALRTIHQPAWEERQRRKRIGPWI